MSVLSDKVISVWSMDEVGTATFRFDGKSSNDMEPEGSGFKQNDGTKGRIFRASKFIDRSREWLQATAVSELSPSGNMAISTWVYFAENPPTEPTVGRIIGKWEAGDNEYRLYFNLRKLHFDYQEDAGSLFAVDSTTQLAKAVWHFIVINVDLTAQTIDVWINGKLDQSFAGPNTAVEVTGADVFIGGLNGTEGDVGEHHIGLIDETAIYSSTLTEGEIAALYGKAGNLAAIGTAYPRYVRLENSLTALYHFEDATSVLFTPGSAAPNLDSNVGYTFSNTAPALNGKYAKEDGIGLNRMYRLSHPDLLFLGSMSIAVWVYVHGAAPLPQTIVWKGEDGGPFPLIEWHLWIDANRKVNFDRTEDGFQITRITADDLIITEQWNLIVAVHDAVAENLFISVTPNNLTTVNDFDEEDYDPGQDIYASANDIIVGAKWDEDEETYTQIFRGRMDELMFWCRALDTDDLERLYCFGNSGEHGSFYTGFKCAVSESVSIGHKASASSVPRGVIQGNVRLMQKGEALGASVATMTVPVTLAGKSATSATGGFSTDDSLTFAVNATFTQVHTTAANVVATLASKSTMTPADQLGWNPSIAFGSNHAMRPVGGFIIEESTVSLDSTGAISTAFQVAVPGSVTFAGKQVITPTPGQTVDVALTFTQQVGITGDGRLPATEVCFTDEKLVVASAVGERLKTAKFDTENLVSAKMTDESLDACN